jgi:hypothetical protein
MTYHNNIKQAFWTIIESQAQDRGHTLTSFNREVAQTILNGGLLAYEDRLEIKAQYRVISAPTGSGKSSYAWALIAALIQAVPGSSALFLCETIDQCEDTYKELAKLVDSNELGIWTSAHDRSKPLEDIRREYEFTPSARFFARDLTSHRVAIVTHAFYRGPRGDQARNYEGQPRTLTVVDERPKEVSLFDIDQGDVAKALDWAVVKFGNDTPAEKALKALRDYLVDTWETERPKGKNFKPLKRSDMSWFTSEEASAVLSEKPDSLEGIVIGFAQSLATGYAFMSRHDRSTRGGRFVGYRMDLPILPGTVLLDATSDIDGVSQLVDWRTPVPSPRVSYENLTVVHMAPPPEVIGSRERVTEIVKNAKRARPYAEWIRKTVVANTKPGEKVLVVTHKALLAHEYLPESVSLGEDSYDLEGRKVAFINWGYGIGSNRWKEATSVFLFGEFHIPKRGTVGTTLALIDQPAGTPRLDGMQSPNSQDEVFLSLQHGHLMRWEKQLAMRGNARNLTPDGVCGKQKLFVTSEFKRFSQYRKRLFPGATFIVDSSVSETASEKGGCGAVAALLMSSEQSCITSLGVKAITGVILKKNPERIVSNPLVKQAMQEGGWVYVSGGGRGNPSRFERVSNTDQDGAVIDLAA